MNPCIEKQLQRRSIRAFKDTPIPQETIDLLIEVARHSATASFGQQVSLISVTDPKIKEELALICEQHYVAQAAHLFVLVLDMYRNVAITKEAGVDAVLSRSTDRFLSSVMDASIMAQNIVTAAESLNYGTVFLGSIENDSRKVIELLKLPEYTFPLVGVAIGVPDQSPQIKPKLPQELIHFENEYKVFANYHEVMKDYDELVETYYDLRDANRRVDSFTKQMVRRSENMHPKRRETLEVLHDQKLLKF